MAVGAEEISLPGRAIRISVMKITVCATKGGVGKTTLAANLGGIIAGQGKRVLLIDTDPQPSLTSYYQLATGDCNSGLTNLLTGDLQPAARNTSINNLDIIVSDDPTGALEAQLLHAPDGRFRLVQRLQAIDGYDVTIIDTRGATGTLVESAILAADICLSPLPPEMLSAQEFLRGTANLVKNLASLSMFGISPGHLFALFYRCDRTNDSKAVMQSVTEALQRTDVTLLRAVIPNRVVYREAASRQLPVHLLEPTRRTGPSAKEDMEALLKELVVGKMKNRSMK